MIDKVECVYIFDHKLSWRTYRALGLVSSKASENKDSSVILIDIPHHESTEQGVYSVQRNTLGRSILAFHALRYWFQLKSKSESFSTRLDLLAKEKRAASGSENSFIWRLAYYSSKFQVCTPYWLLCLANLSTIRVLKRNKANSVTYVTTGGTNSNSDFLALWTSRQGIGLNVIYENWDGIFTKSVHFKKDIEIYVWGEQGRMEAIGIHGFKPSRVHAFGSPRVHDLVKRKSGMKGGQSHVLFAGGSLDWNTEMDYLELTAREFENQVIFLPHPKRYGESLEYYDSISALGVDMNRDLVTSLLIEKTLPNLDLYKKLLLNAKVTISPMSTMALESALSGIPTIVPAGKDWSSSPLITRYGHLKGISLFPNVRISYDYQEFVKYLRNTESLYQNKASLLQNYFLSDAKEFKQILLTLFPNSRNTI